VPKEHALAVFIAVYDSVDATTEEIAKELKEAAKS